MRGTVVGAHGTKRGGDGTDLGIEEIQNCDVVVIYSVAVGERESPTPVVFASDLPSKPPVSGRKVGQDVSLVLFATRWITPESTVFPTLEIAWK